MAAHIDLDSELEQIRQIFQIPGMAVAVVERGELILSQGYGYSHLETQQPFTPETLCLVASVTKSFTAGLAGILVDEGLLDWTQPIREYWPPLRMVDPFATQEITFEDMLCHRSGLPDHENLLVHGLDRELSDPGREYRQDLLYRLAYFEPCHPFRSQFQYQDIVYTCAGGILEVITDTHYEDLIRQRLLLPLGMQTSTFCRREARDSQRLAQGYGLVKGSIQPISFCDTRYMAPCAGLYTSAIELIPWVQLQLNQGRWGSDQLISTASMNWIHRPHMIAMVLSEAVGGGLATYGQGWVQSMLHGQMLICHGGSFNGYRSFVGFLPQSQIGVAVLCNLNLTNGMTVAGLTILDTLLGIDQLADRIHHYHALADKFKQAEIRAKQEFLAGQDLSQPPSQDLDHYTGCFHHPGYGTFILENRQGSLWQTYDGRSFPVDPYCGDTWATRFQSTEDHLLPMTLAFESDGHPQATAVRVPIVPGIDPPRFVRCSTSDTPISVNS